MRSILCLVCLLLVPAAICPASGQEAPAALTSLVEAERAFSRRSVAVGVRESFYEFFAEDGVGFQPQPSVFREGYRSQPAPPQRPPVRLSWEPVFADVSAAGDLGYTTGPYVMADTSDAARPPRYGYYFSVWQKQSDGSWKVRADMGTPTAEAPPARSLAYYPSPAAPAAAPADTSLVRGLERRFADGVAAEGLAAAYAARADAYTRLHRFGPQPVVGADAVRAFLADDARTMTWTPEATAIAASGDLGFSYGPYTLAPRAGGDGEAETGYYLHVWRRAAGGDWRLAASIHNPEPR